MQQHLHLLFVLLCLGCFCSCQKNCTKGYFTSESLLKLDSYGRSVQIIDSALDDSTGNFYISIFCFETTSFGAFTVAFSTPAILKYSSSGVLTQVVTITSGDELARQTATVFISIEAGTMFVSGSLVAGSATVNVAGVPVNRLSSSFDFFIAKINLATFSTAWTRSLGIVLSTADTPGLHKIRAINSTHVSMLFSYTTKTTLAGIGAVAGTQLALCSQNTISSTVLQTQGNAQLQSLSYFGGKLLVAFKYDKQYFLKFGAISFYSSGAILEIDMSLKLLWAIEATGSDMHFFRVTYDRQGGIVLYALFEKSLVIGANPIIAPSVINSHIVAKLNPLTRLFVWQNLISAYTSSDVSRCGIDVELSNNILLSCLFSKAVTFGPQVLQPVQLKNCYLTKISSDGTFMWATAPMYSTDSIQLFGAQFYNERAFLFGQFSSKLTLQNGITYSSTSQSFFVASFSPECEACPIGTFSKAEGYLSSSTCAPCPQASFSSNNGTINCTLCRSGTFGNQIGQTSSESCTACDAGYFAMKTGSKICSPCAPGSYVTSLGASECTKCQKGYYMDVLASTSECIKCPTGTYSSTIGASSCIQCNPGYYNEEEGKDKCKPCPFGTYNSESGSSSLQACVPCATGTMSSVSGSTQCVACQIGYVANTTGLRACQPCEEGFRAHDSVSCVACEKGKYNPTAGAYSCIVCPPGTYSDIEGAKKCLYCKSGTYNEQYGATSEFQCIKCPKGSYSNTLGSASSNECDICPAGTYSDVEGIVSVASCKPCPKGTASRTGGISSEEACEKCANGTYSAAIQAPSCTPCLPGFFSAKLVNIECTPCPVGTFSLTGASYCTKCPPGMISSIASSSCQLCGEGFYSSKDGASCQPCQLGYYSNNAQASSVETCVPCPKGHYSAVYGAKICQPCPIGQYGENDGASHCFSCSPGYYSSDIAATNCTSCSAGTSLPFPNAISSQACIRCKPGFYSKYGSSSCTPCNAGFYASSEGSENCVPCAKGHFSTSNSEGIFKCNPCAKGYFSDMEGQSMCFQCNAGTFAEKEASVTCKNCTSNSVAPNIGAVSCSPCDSGSVASIDGTKCDKISDSLGLSSSQVVGIAVGSSTGGIAFIAICFVIMFLVLCCFNISRKKPMSDVHVQLLDTQDSELDNITFDTSLFSISVDELQIQKEIGSGGSGAVCYTALWNKRIVVVKLFKYDEQKMEEFANEFKLLTSLRDKNLVYFYGACLKKPRIGLVMEYCNNGSLRHYVATSKPSFKKKVSLAMEIARGLLFLHSRNIIHRDIKSDNVLIDEDLHAKITDFGIAKHAAQKNMTSRIGTSQYMAPEVVRGEHYSLKCDVFSFAIVLFELLTENFDPYGNIAAVELQVANNADFRPKFPDSLTKDFQSNESVALVVQIVKSCWHDLPSMRPSFDKIVGELEECYALTYK